MAFKWIIVSRHGTLIGASSGSPLSDTAFERISERLVIDFTVSLSVNRDKLNPNSLVRNAGERAFHVSAFGILVLNGEPFIRHSLARAL